jgi:hypothetical protein
VYIGTRKLNTTSLGHHSFRPLVVVMTCVQCKRCPGWRMAGFRKFQQPSCITHIGSFHTPVMPFHTARLADDDLHDLGFPKRSATILSFLFLVWLQAFSKLTLRCPPEAYIVMNLTLPYTRNRHKIKHTTNIYLLSSVYEQGASEASHETTKSHFTSSCYTPWSRGQN